MVEVKADKAPPLNVTMKKGVAKGADPMVDVNAQLQTAAEPRAVGKNPGGAEDLRGPAREVPADLSARRVHRAHLCGRKQRPAKAMRAPESRAREGAERTSN